mgnify:CR=1 FL=1
MIKLTFSLLIGGNYQHNISHEYKPNWVGSIEHDFVNINVQFMTFMYK